ncbi:hypothetical protein EYF80_053906 [Liparis tanakae]|uniref:Uncharacterized protein n=1 Tax=Liparis tanakae TaxID=230148 RepID=A0A4Z2F4A1_9TELE|nr:hypothetical protein EYF80_053906 [Liparis tanakae]
MPRVISVVNLSIGAAAEAAPEGRRDKAGGEEQDGIPSLGAVAKAEHSKYSFPELSSTYAENQVVKVPG